MRRTTRTEIEIKTRDKKKGGKKVGASKKKQTHTKGAKDTKESKKAEPEKTEKSEAKE